jgi:hypothetical protein
MEASNNTVLFYFILKVHIRPCFKNEKTVRLWLWPPRFQVYRWQGCALFSLCVSRPSPFQASAGRQASCGQVVVPVPDLSSGAQALCSSSAKVEALTLTSNPNPNWSISPARWRRVSVSCWIQWTPFKLLLQHCVLLDFWTTVWNSTSRSRHK